MKREREKQIHEFSSLISAEWIWFCFTFCLTFGFDRIVRRKSRKTDLVTHHSQKTSSCCRFFSSSFFQFLYFPVVVPRFLNTSHHHVQQFEIEYDSNKNHSFRMVVDVLRSIQMNKTLLFFFFLSLFLSSVFCATIDHESIE